MPKRVHPRNLRWLRLLRHVAALTSLLAGGGHAAAADTPERVARIVYVAPDRASSSATTLRPLRDRLRELGWIDGRNVVLEEYWGEGDLQRLPQLMREALARNPDVLITSSTPGAIAAKRATSTVPIVVAAMGDPVQTGVVSNLARPGGNLTALSSGYTDGFAGKWLELLLEAVPQASTVAVIWNLGNPVVLSYRSDLEKAAAARRVGLRFIDVRQASHLPQTFRQAKRTAQAAVVVCENLFIQHSQQVVDLAAHYRLPTIYCLSRFAHEGGLMAYGTDLRAMFRRAAEYVDKILRGANAGDLPVEQPTRFELVVNLRTAKSLGITMPKSILIRANEVIR